MNKYRYTAYGLEISSEIMLPQLLESTNCEPADLVIRRGKVDLALPAPFESWSHIHLDGDTSYLCWRIVGKFAIRAGKEIIIDALCDVEERTICLPLLGPVMATAMHQRQFLILHGNGVAINGDNGAAIFVGRSGQGKSTMSAALYKHGHPLITDDVTAINVMDNDVPTVSPSFPQIKLWPESVESTLKEDVESLSRVHPEVEKRLFRLFDRFYPHVCNIKKIYVLATGDKLQISPLQGHEAVKAIIANSYMPMFLGQEFINDRYYKLHLQQCTKLVNSVAVARLERPRSLDLLKDVVQLVESEPEWTTESQKGREHQSLL